MKHPIQYMSDIPYPKWWGVVVRSIKTIEVLVFKLLQIFNFYRPQKSIVAIPSLATRTFTNLHAVIYNGTQKEVLNFLPKRIMHRLLKGVPDLEFYERLRFELDIDEKHKRMAEGSTQTRGFVQLQLPWSMPLRPPKQSFLKISPLGVETLFGRIQLGDYEVLSSPVFFLSKEIKWIIVSDIDDTIKDSNIAHSTSFKTILRSIFKGHYYTYEAIPGMAEIYQKLAEKGVLIIYLTSTPYQLTPFLLKFLRDQKFPEGPVFPRWLGYGKFGHKWRTIHRILSNSEDQRFIFIGDSGEQDLQIYRRISETERFAEKIERIFIRHIPGTPIQKTLHEREIYYREINELQTQIDQLIT